MATPPKLTRAAQVVRFLQVSWLLLWTMWIIYRERCRVIRAYTSGNYAVRADSEALLRAVTAFRDRALKLGILMIKFGQFLSLRADLLPESALGILSALHDDVPAAPFEHIESIIEAELGRPIAEVFSMLERQCTAAASLGQVHKAVLAATGEVVALKIQRPHADQLIIVDLRAMKFVLWLITSFVRIEAFVDFAGIFHEFERTTYEEIDYVREAANAKRFKEMFRDNPYIYVPRVYDQFVSRRLLVLEWIDGIKVNDYAALDDAGISRLEVVRLTVCAYFYQLFDAGFFHADPHPGNIFVKKDAAGTHPIVAFVDFGMMSSHTRTIKKALKDAFLAIIAHDTQSLMHALTRLGFIDKGADLVAIERSLALLLERYFDTTFGEISKVDIVEMIQDARHLFYGQPFQIPAQFAFTGRAISTLFGLSSSLAPEFNIIEVAIPYAQKFLGLDAEGLAQSAYQLIEQVIDAGKALLTLPSTLEQLLNAFERGEIHIELPAEGSIRLRGSRVSAAMPGKSGFTWCLFFTVSLAGGIFLLAGAHQLIAGWFCLALSAMTTLRLMLR